MPLGRIRFRRFELGRCSRLAVGRAVLVGLGGLRVRVQHLPGLTMVGRPVVTLSVFVGHSGFAPDARAARAIPVSCSSSATESRAWWPQAQGFVGQLKVETQKYINVRGGAGFYARHGCEHAGAIHPTAA